MQFPAAVMSHDLDDLDWWTLLFPKAAFVLGRASEVHACIKYSTNCKVRQYNA